MCGDGTLRKTSFLIEIFLIAMAAILLEISYTRIFSFKLYYYFTYLIIGIAMLGLGAGGVAAAISPGLRRAQASSVVLWSSLGAGALVPVSYLTVSLIQLNTIDFVQGAAPLLRLTIVCTSLFAPFLAIGIALAVIFGSRPQEMHRLYFADLLGAGLGCALCVPLFTSLAPPRTIVLGGLLLSLVALRASRRGRPVAFAASLGLAAILTAPLLAPGLLPDPIVDRTKTLSPQLREDRATLFTRWSPLFRIDVIPETTTKGDRYLITHDGMAGSGLHRFDGDFSMIDGFERDIRAQPFSVLDPRPEVLIIGAAGGHEILASLYFGAVSITALELNPVTVSLLRDHFADFTGRIAFQDRVRLVNAEGRSFLQRDRNKYDLIWFVAPDSYASMNAASSGAYVLSESYLFTVEMIQESLAHLAEGGVLCVQWGEFYRYRNRTVRYIATAREAFRRLGIEDLSQHVILSTGPGLPPTSTILLRNQPFDRTEVQRFAARTADIPKARLRHPTPPRADARAHPMTALIWLPQEQLEAWYDDYRYAVSPVTDDAPFFWHFTRFRDAFAAAWRVGPDAPGWELAVGEQTLLILLCFVMAFAAVFLLLPLLVVRDVWRRVPHKRHAFLYFAGLGLGFMFFEVCLIQKLTLFLGYPTYSLTVTLFSLLVFSGIGSLLSSRYSEGRRRNAALSMLLAAVVVLMLAYRFGLTSVVGAFGGWPLALRASIAVLLLAPLGVCLGAFMPIGIRSVAATTEYEREYVAWAWAVNGFFSVVASVLATILAMSLGFGTVLLLAVVAYAIGVAALMRIPAPA